MDREKLNKALEKFSIGSSISDEELIALLKLFHRLEQDLGSLTHHLNHGFGLAFESVMRGARTLEGFKEARLQHAMEQRKQR